MQSKKKEKFICTQCFLTTKNHIVTPFNPEISKQNHPQKKITQLLTYYVSSLYLKFHAEN